MTDFKNPAEFRREVWGLLGFLVLASAQVSNMILARAVAGSVPPFTIAFFRWGLVALGLSPAIIAALRSHPGTLRADGAAIAATGFLGMFLCGGPVYVAGETTSAINIALIMALSPLVVLVVSWLLRLDVIRGGQIVGMLISLAGAVLIIMRGRSAGSAGPTAGDILALLAMMAWAGYTLMQNRAGPSLGFLARVGLFAAAGALFSLPFAGYEMWSRPEAVFTTHALAVYLFAGLVPGLFAYTAYAYLGSAFGAISTALSLYLGPIVSAILSIALLGEAPTLVHVIGGTLSLGGLWWSMRAKKGK
jgi:drug/metabolite transporter (DMT)-like permease